MQSKLMAAAAAALVLGSASSQAATFELSLSGSSTHWYYYGVPGGCNPGAPNFSECQAGFAPTVWTGGLTVQTSSAVDGTYGYGAGLESLTFASNLGDFTYHDGDTQTIFYSPFADLELPIGLAPGASVMVLDGRVVSVSAEWDWANFTPTTFDGLFVSEPGGTAPYLAPTADWWNVSGALTPVPEPAQLLLWMAALAALTLRGSKVKSNAVRPAASILS